MTAPDFYTILGVSPTITSASELRKAFRAAALRYHPDKNRGDALAEARFKEISIAFQTLSDTDRRRAYDARRQYGVGFSGDVDEGIWGGGFEGDVEDVEGYDAFEDFAARNAFVSSLDGEMGQDVDAEVLFASLFGKRRESVVRMGEGGGEGVKGRKEEMGLDVEEGVLKDGIRGKLQRGGKVVGDGMGGGNGENLQGKGKGKKCADRVIELPLTLEELFFGCKKHRKISRKLKMKIVEAVKRGSVGSNNSGNVGEKTLTIVVQPGYRPGDRIRFHNVGDEEVGKMAGDIVFKITQKKHATFVRYGDNLRRKVLVSLSDALTGLSTTVDGVGGNKIPIVCKDVLTPGTTKVIKGEGMPRRGKSNERGDLTLEFAIFYPTKLSSEEKIKIRDCLAEPSSRWERLFLVDRKDATSYVSGEKKAITSSHRRSKRASKRVPPETVPTRGSVRHSKKAATAPSGLPSSKRRLNLSPSKRFIGLFR